MSASPQQYHQHGFVPSAATMPGYPTAHHENHHQQQQPFVALHRQQQQQPHHFHYAAADGYAAASRMTAQPAFHHHGHVQDPIVWAQPNTMYVYGTPQQPPRQLIYAKKTSPNHPGLEASKPHVASGSIPQSKPSSSSAAPAPVVEESRRRMEEPFRALKASATEKAQLAAAGSPLCPRKSDGWNTMVRALEHPDRALRCTETFLDAFPAYRYMLNELTLEDGRIPRRNLVARGVRGGYCPPEMVASVSVLSIGQLPFSITAEEVHGLLEYFVPGSVVFVTTELAEKARRRGLWFAVVRDQFVDTIIHCLHHRLLYGVDDVRHLVPRCGELSGFRTVAEILAERDVVARDATEDLDVTLNVAGKFNGGVWPVTVQAADEDMKQKVVPASGRRVDYSGDGSFEGLQASKKPAPSPLPLPKGPILSQRFGSPRHCSPTIFPTSFARF